MTFGSTFGRVFSPTFKPTSQAAAAAVSSWWLAGGIAAANCIAAYQPKGAASYAASKVNLANPGTLNAVDGAAYPTWSAATGWSFVAASTQKLVPDIPFVNGWTAIVRVAGATAGTSFGIGATSANSIAAVLHWATFTRFYWRAANDQLAYGITDGILAINNEHGYYNGSSVCDTGEALSTVSGCKMQIGCAEFDADNYNNYFTGTVVAFAVYNANLTIEQIGAVGTAMAAL